MSTSPPSALLVAVPLALSDASYPIEFIRTLYQLYDLIRSKDLL